MTFHSCISVLVGDVVIDTRAKRARIFEYRTGEYLSDVRTNIVHAQRAREYPSDVRRNIVHAQRAYEYPQWYCRYWRTIFRYDNDVRVTKYYFDTGSYGNELGSVDSGCCEEDVLQP
jgi:hypothetical protein